MFFPTFILTTTISWTIASNNNISNLMKAVEGKNIDKVKELLDIVDISSKDGYGFNVLHAAVDSTGDITRFLISHGADRVVNDYTCFVPPPLIYTCSISYGHEYSQTHIYEIMEALLKAGADPNLADLTLRTPLHHITTGSQARLLLSYGANANAKDTNGSTPALACFSTQYRRINPEVLYALAEGDADFAITNNFGDTIFHMKTELNASLWTKELVIFLARNGVPLDALNNSGETALTKVLKRDLRLNFGGIVNQSTLYESLKNSFYAHMAEAGANLNARNKHGQTLMHLAAFEYQEGMVRWLLENGADVEAKNANGDPPLLALVKKEKWNYEKSYYFLPCKHKTAKVRALIDVLVEGGADVGFKDGGGHDAAYYLRKSRMTWVDWYIESSLKKDDQNAKNLYIFFGT